MRYWLMKSEPDEFSVDDLAAAPGGRAPWTGVRNYQARNYMRDAMRPGDGVLFYHSSCPEPGIAGIAEVASEARPDETQFDPASEYFDARATRAAPRWVYVDVRLVAKTPFVSLAGLRRHKSLAKMVLLQRGSRLSVSPVTPKEWQYITTKLMGRPC